MTHASLRLHRHPLSGHSLRAELLSSLLQLPYQRIDVAHAPEGGVSLEPYPHIQRWLGAIEALPHFVAMQRTPARS